MKLTATIENTATLSSGVSISPFKINASAKAFSILSSALYSNKIRAIIRELSTNARDSHISAGKESVPFEVHLPTQLENWFAVKDFGLGLDAEEVTSIYTTYFESTKTNSNDLVGCLGLGSKSPFSYTDNFTITAIKNSKKGIYTAFLDDKGIPNIALLSQSATTEEPGVEVKFAVIRDNDDFKSFSHEAKSLFAYFSVKPVFTGQVVHIVRPAYSALNIAEGVNVFEGNQSTTAVMGSIAYLVNFPNPEVSLGNLAVWLKCKLEINFAIGELDVQPSREGLSFTQGTIQAIKNRLQLINDAVAVTIANEADMIENHWKRAVYLSGKSRYSIWKNAVSTYVTSTKFPLLTVSPTYHSPTPWSICFTEIELAEQFNISVTAFSHHKGCRTIRDYPPSRILGRDLLTTVKNWKFTVSDSSYFVVNMKKIGLSVKAKTHWRTNPMTDTDNSHVFVLNPADATKPVNSVAFLSAIRDPHRVMNNDYFLDQVKLTRNAGKPKSAVKVLTLTNTDSSYAPDMIWDNGKEIDQFDTAIDHYYLPLSDHVLITEYGKILPRDLVHAFMRSGINHNISRVLGVRVANLEDINHRKNWINLESFIISRLSSMTNDEVATIASYKLKAPILRSMLGDNFLRLQIVNKSSRILSVLGPASLLISTAFRKEYINSLTNRYLKNTTVSQKVVKASNTFTDVLSHYPMLSLIPELEYKTNLVAHYINLVDSAI